jgi:hypothetical protein
MQRDLRELSPTPPNKKIYRYLGDLKQRDLRNQNPPKKGIKIDGLY